MKVPEGTPSQGKYREWTKVNKLIKSTEFLEHSSRLESENLSDEGDSQGPSTVGSVDFYLLYFAILRL